MSEANIEQWRAQN